MRVRRPWRWAGTVLALTLGWTVLQVSLLIPIAEHVTGEQQDMGEFGELQGNLGLLLGLVAASWVLGAVVEEIAFRGYLRTRLVDALGARPVAATAATLVAAVLFGLIHTEQGAVGVMITTADALFFTVLARRSASGLWERSWPTGSTTPSAW